MKQFVLWMAIVGLATTGCSQNRVFGPHARRGGADLKIAKSRALPRPSVRTAMTEQEQDNVELAMFGGSCGDGCCDCYGDSCCGDCAADCYCDSSGQCCGESCCDSGCCTGNGCSSGCSACGSSGCGLCQRFAGRVASGFCPHAAGYPEAYNYTPSPPSGQITYPYYTVRGPRDFLRNNPPSIGPY